MATTQRMVLSELIQTGYDVVIFFSLPFCALDQRFPGKRINYGHLSTGLGDTVFQMVEPKRLQSRFLISRMPMACWLYEDGPWRDWDPDSPTYRHIHLYKKAEVKRTAIFYGAIKMADRAKLPAYEAYFEGMEQAFQAGQQDFRLILNNCTNAVCRLFYKEGWLKKSFFDFIPAVAFKRLINTWEKDGRDFKIGCLAEEREVDHFCLQKFCPGIHAVDAFAGMVAWLKSKNSQYQAGPCQGTSPTKVILMTSPSA
jgi:hypothetical protein